MKLRWIVALLLTAAMHAQSAQSGHSAMSGLFSSQNQANNGGPLTYSARTDMAVFGTGVTGELLPSACGGDAACLANAYNASATTGHEGAALSYTGSPTMAPPAAGTSVSGTNINGLNSYLAGYNRQVTDPDFGTTLIRATDATLFGSVSCLGAGNFGSSFGMGAGTGNLAWASDESKLRILSSGGSASILAFNPSTGVVTPTDICGGYMPGAATFSGTKPHILFTGNNDQENTVQFSSSTGTFITTETVTNGSASAELMAINSNFAQFGEVSGNTSGNVWTGTISGAQLTAVTNPPKGTGGVTPYANTIYKGVICDGATSDPDESAACGSRNPWYGSSNATCANAGNSTNPLCWYVQWSLMFSFNYLPAMVGDAHFPTGDHCLPQNYNASYTGVMAPSTDDTAFTIAFGDNGQANHTGYNGGGSGPTYVCPQSPGGVCTGPVYEANYRVGQGCRVLNSMTDQITGDWGPTGQALDAQANVITGTATGSPTPDDHWTQDVTGATTQMWCMQNSSGQCSSSGWTQAYTGLIFGTADASHTWRDSNGASFAPSAAPTNAPFYYPDVMHDSTQAPNANFTTFSLVQQPDMKVTGVSYNASTHQTTVTYSNNTAHSPGQQFIFYNLAGTHDAYMECTDMQHCPVFTAVAIPNTGGSVCDPSLLYCPSGSNGTITITDTLGGGSNYSDSESQSGCGNDCPTMTPNPQDTQTIAGGFGGLNIWQTQTLLLAADLRATGHHSDGDHYIFQGKWYTAINALAPSTPATIADMGSGNAECQVAGSPCGLPYPGPETPPPGADSIQMLPYSIADDQHGSMGGHGPNDLTPPAMVTTLVCGQALSGVGASPCQSQYSSVWDSEIIAIENWVTRSSPGNLAGADCNYGSGAAPCVYRLNHTFNSDDNWLFTGQNAMGIMSPDGNWFAFPSDWNKTLGCIDLSTTNCWSSWEATAPTASGTNTAWSVDSGGNVTITMSNSLCPTGGTQAWPDGGTINCGTRAGTVTLSGFAQDTWLNGTFTLGANTSNNWGCASGTCTAFVGTIAGASSHLNSSGSETSGTQKVTPTACGAGNPCQREDIWIANISSAHQ